MTAYALFVIHVRIVQCLFWMFRCFWMNISFSIWFSGQIVIFTSNMVLIKFSLFKLNVCENIDILELKLFIIIKSLLSTHSENYYLYFDDGIYTKRNFKIKYHHMFFSNMQKERERERDYKYYPQYQTHTITHINLKMMIMCAWHRW